jgi:predicted GNAT family acetyltransferase
MAAKVVAQTKIKREKGFLYFVDKKGNVARVKASVGGKKGGGKVEVVAKADVKKKAGFMYFVDKAGNVAEVLMNRKGGKKKKKKK